MAADHNLQASEMVCSLESNKLPTTINMVSISHTKEGFFFLLCLLPYGMRHTIAKVKKMFRSISRYGKYAQ